MPSNDKLRVAIIGAGIGGLTLSAALGSLSDRQDLEIDIYEASSHVSTNGAGITFWPRGWSMLKAIGLEERLVRVLPQAPDDTTSRIAFSIRKGDQHEGVHIKDIKIPGGTIRFHRADLHQALLSSQSGRLHLSHQFVSYEERGEEILVKFEDGKAATCDLLVGMDGINSSVRKCFLTNQGFQNSPSMNPVWVGDTVYRALIPIEKLEAMFPGHHAITTPMIYAGKSKHIVTYPISDEKVVNFVAYHTNYMKEGIEYNGPTAEPSSQEEVFSLFGGFETEALGLVQCAEDLTKYIMRCLNPMDRYTFGRVILGGDAAHAMTPLLGAGGGQTIEDAYILASLISDRLCTRNTVPRISEIYNTVCCSTGNQVLERSSTSARLIQFLTPGLEDIVEGDTQVPFERLVGIMNEYDNMLGWLWKESAEVQKNQALDLLKGINTVTDES